MSLSRERVILLAVLGLGLAALMFDRLVLGGGTEPASATAQSVESFAAPASTSENKSAPAPALSAPAAVQGEPSVGQRLERLTEHRDTLLASDRDGFTPSVSWTGREGPSAGSLRDQIDFIKQFQRDHELLAVMKDDQGQDLAIVNGEPLVIGQRLGVFTLVEVRSDKQQRSAVFESRYGRTELVITTDR